MCQDVLRERKKPISGLVFHVLGFVSVSYSFSLSDKFSSSPDDSSSPPIACPSDATIAKFFTVNICVCVCGWVLTITRVASGRRNVDTVNQPGCGWTVWVNLLLSRILLIFKTVFIYNQSLQCRHQNIWWLKVKIILKRHHFISIFRTPWHFCCPWLWLEKQVPGRTSPPWWKNIIFGLIQLTLPLVQQWLFDIYMIRNTNLEIPGRYWLAYIKGRTGRKQIHDSGSLFTIATRDSSAHLEHL